MSVCRCGVEVRWCALGVADKLVPIEPNISLTSGPDRYAVTEYGERWYVEALDPNSTSSGHPDHRPRCPR